MVIVFQNEHVSKLNATNYRRSCLEVFCEKVVLKNFAKFSSRTKQTKYLCQSLLFNKYLRPGTLLKRRLWYRCFL